MMPQSETHPLPKGGPLYDKVQALTPVWAKNFGRPHQDILFFRDRTGYRSTNHPITNLALVNAAVNQKIRYQADVKDTWEPYWRTLQRFYGDCEDIAILKYAVLYNGPYKMDLAITKRNKDGIAHAVLFVDVQWESETHTYVLDNNSDKLLRVEDFLKDHTLIYTTNGQTITYYNTEAIGD